MEDANDGSSIRKGNIGGIGQGGGASPIEWLMLLMVMLTTFKMLARGGKIQDPNDETTSIIPMVSFLDDTTIAHTAESNETSEEIFSNATREMIHWRNILRLTGGDLAAEKCTVTLMKWRWNEATGVPEMMDIRDAPGTIVI